MTPKEIRDGQAARLTRLRLVLDASLAEFAERSGLSRHQYGRMERGETHVDGVALAQLVVSLGIPGEYVLTGSMAGLSDPLIRNLVEREVRDREVAAGRMMAVLEPRRRGRPRRKSTARTEPEGVPAAAGRGGELAAAGVRLRKVT